MAHISVKISVFSSSRDAETVFFLKQVSRPTFRSPCSDNVEGGDLFVYAGRIFQSFLASLILFDGSQNGVVMLLYLAILCFLL